MSLSALIRICKICLVLMSLLLSVLMLNFLVLSFLCYLPELCLILARNKTFKCITRSHYVQISRHVRKRKTLASSLTFKIQKPWRKTDLFTKNSNQYSLLKGRQGYINKFPMNHPAIYLNKDFPLLSGIELTQIPLSILSIQHYQCSQSKN